MPKRRTGALFAALVRLALASSLCSPAMADDPADTSRLPRPPGAKVVYASAQTTILTTNEAPELSARTLQELLAKAGWQPYGDPSGRPFVDPGAHYVVARNGAVDLRVRIASSGGQGGSTTINYVTSPLRHDIPFPPGGTELKLDADTPHLEALTAESFDGVSAFYVRELQTRGWSLHQPPDGSPAFAGDGSSQRAFLTKAGQRPLLLFMRRHESGRTAVKLEAVSPQLLPGAQAKKTPPPPPKEPAREENPAFDRQADALIADVLKQVQRDIKGLPAPGSAPPRAQPGPQPVPNVLAGHTAPIPLPEGATDVTVDDAAGSVEFSTRTAVTALAQFFRREMPKAGWTVSATPINRDNMVALTCARGGKSINLTMMRFGEGSRVTAQGVALVSKAASVSSAESAQPSQPDPALEAVDSGGLPVPKPNSSVGRTKSLFRKEAFAVVPASPASILAFYQRELSARGWTPSGAPRTSKAGTMAEFSSPEGPARLTLERKGGETHVTLAVRQDAEAQKSGLMPKPGHARILLGSLPEITSSVVIRGKTIKIPPGAGKKGGDGPTVEVPAGKHEVTVRISGKAPLKEIMTVEAGEIWGLLIGPNGALPLQAY